MRAGRPMDEIEAALAANDAAIAAGDRALFETTLDASITTDDEDHARSEAWVFADAVAHMPSVPDWLAQVYGLTEVGRWTFAAMLEMGVVAVLDPVTDAMVARLDIRNPRLSDMIGRAIDELCEVGFLRRIKGGVMVVRRVA